MNAVQILAEGFGRHADAQRIDSMEGGFSGSKIHRVRMNDGVWCLRRWPTSVTPDRVEWIHQRLGQLETAGVGELSIPIQIHPGKRMCRAETCFIHQGCIWELSPWLAGTADFHAQPNSTRLANAMRWLAEFHLACERLGATTDFPQPRYVGPSQGIAQRLEGIARTRSERIGTIKAAHAKSSDTEQRIQVSKTIIDGFDRLCDHAYRQLMAASQLSVSQHLCLRDIWHDHVLFTNDKVTGVVDYDALRVESAAGDIARLLGSLVENDANAWAAGISAYHASRPVSELTRQLITAFDLGNVMLSGLQWLEWRYVERRTFAFTPAADARIGHWSRRITQKRLESC